jgi:hypothetical protein
VRGTRLAPISTLTACLTAACTSQLTHAPAATSAPPPPPNTHTCPPCRREELGIRAHNMLAGARSRGGEGYHQPSPVALLLQDERRLGIPHFSVYRGLDFLQVYGSREGSMRADDSSSSAAVQLAKRRLEEAVTAGSEGRRVSGSGGAKDSARAGLESDKKMLSLSQVRWGVGCRVHGAVAAARLRAP